jgi:hypothetical protein
MGYYDVQQVCLNGHQITDRYNDYPQHRKQHCPECGAATIHQCTECNAAIPGEYHVDGVFLAGSETQVPTYCAKCGEPFPWTRKEAKTANELRGGELGNAATLIDAICARFHLVVRQLRVRHSDRSTLDVNDEYDIQDLLHSLLLLFFEDVRAEEYTPSYAAKSARMDFLLRNEAIVVEAKMSRPGLTGKQVGEQLILDIARYQIHPNCKMLFCLVYDPDGRIQNPRGLESDLSGKQNGIEVKVYVIPKGY